MKQRKKRVEYGVLYLPDGTTKDVYPADGKKFTYKELKANVGGFLEQVICGVPHCRAYVDEEGALFNSLAPNPFTWAVLNRKVYGLNGYAESWRVSGPIFMVGRVDANL